MGSNIVCMDSTRGRPICSFAPGSRATYANRHEPSRTCHPPYRRDLTAPRPAARVALLIELGLLPERRARTDPADHRAGAAVRKERSDAALMALTDLPGRNDRSAARPRAPAPSPAGTP